MTRAKLQGESGFLKKVWISKTNVLFDKNKRLLAASKVQYMYMVCSAFLHCNNSPRNLFYSKITLLAGKLAAGILSVAVLMVFLVTLIVELCLHNKSKCVFCRRPADCYLVACYYKLRKPNGKKICLNFHLY